MDRKRPLPLSILIILIIFGSIAGILLSVPYYQIYSSLKQGGIVVKDKVTIHEVQPDTPAQTAGLAAGDIIISANGTPVNTSDDLIRITNDHPGEFIEITYLREGATYSVQIMPRENPPPGQGRTGMVLTNTKIEKKPWFFLVPYELIRAYSGNEVQRIGIFMQSAYKDTTYSRLKSLVTSIYSLIVGIGLWKLKKWALYGYLLITAWEVLRTLTVFLNPMPIPPVIYIVWIAISLAIAGYIYRQKRLFRY